jgi:hypothetical protein
MELKEKKKGFFRRLWPASLRPARPVKLQQILPTSLCRLKMGWAATEGMLWQGKLNSEEKLSLLGEINRVSIVSSAKYFRCVTSCKLLSNIFQIFF